MADNTVLNTGSGGDTIASDDIGGVKFQRVKLVEGADGTNDGDISAANPLPVDISDSASRDLGKVDIAAFDVALPAGTNAIGKLVANSGVDIGDVDVLSCALPTGASTAAKQPALGTAGTASTDVITVQGITSMTPLVVDLGANNDVTVTSGAITETNSAAILADTANMDTNLGTIAGDTTSIDGKITACNTGAVVLAAGTAAFGKLSANSGVDIGDVDVTSCALPTGAATAANQSTEITALQLLDNTVVSHDAVASSAGNQVMGESRTTNATAVADGDAVRIMCDDQGRVVTSPHSVRDLVNIQQTNLANTTETTIVTAAASTFHDIVGFTVHNAGAALNQVTIRDSTAGTTRFVFQLAADGGGTVFTPCIPIPQASTNNNWTAQASVSGDVDITALYIKRT